ncbi:uncharacterized protein F5147DRAFT_724782 [Suillus discolor]|uniref:Uncharacterized protein n=1 Tax=Suillus discolor TaxID=1912936 RepID=A0A9P7EVE0_9AGAM|nr:uncharacterized protein F5147DRAFT_724782 [Suillus discolor]KAG2090379.1 hypothetical protein F5147DRAFT_724782 [Suillus discolor]
MTSCLIVKNLPTYLTPDCLGTYSVQQLQGAPSGTITDVKSKTAHRIDSVSGWFDRTFIGSTRINVVAVADVKDAPAF